MGTVVDLDISGMSCASCASRIQKKINDLPGAEGSVNFATNSARIELDPENCSLDSVIDLVDDLGYEARRHVSEFAPQDSTSNSDDADSEHSEHSHHAGSAADLKRRLIVAAPLTFVVATLGMVPALHSQMWSIWTAVVLSAPVVWWSGWPIHQSNLRGLRHRSVGMDTLVSLGASVAWFWSLYQAISGGREVYAEVSAVVITFVLLGRWLEARATDSSVDAVAALSRLQVDRVTLLKPNGDEESVPLSQLTTGDHFVVRPGERVATDGLVTEGRTAVDLSLVTGESVPVEVEIGSEVVGGSVNGSGRVVVEATAVGSDTVLARIAALVKQAQAGKAPVERLVDRIAGVFVPIVLLLSLLTLSGWLLFGDDVSFAISAAVAVLVIACPCALGLATPTALVAGTGRGAQLGILIRGPEVLEAAQAVRSVVLDKTGTVTTGKLVVESITGGTVEQRRAVAAVESYSEHPIARAIAADLNDGAELPKVADFLAQPGVGAAGVVEGVRIDIGKITDQLVLDGPLASATADAIQSGATPVLAKFDDVPTAVIVLADTVKPSSKLAIEQLHGMGLTPILLTGDRESTAVEVGRAVAIKEVIADVAPEEKVTEVRRLQQDGTAVAMVGDGINDAAALAQANLGIAMGAGTDAAREAADITVVNSDLQSVADAIALARKTWRTIKQNLGWAFGYNLAAIPLAMSGRLSPMIAGGAMALSSVLVVGNSMRLRRFDPHRDATKQH